MKSCLVSVALLCFTTWMSLVNATHGPMTNCCEQWSTTKIPLHRVKSYTIQSGGVCPIKAIMIRTQRDITLCSNPDDGWTKKAMRKVDEETKALLQQLQIEEDGSATIITPAAVKASQKTGRRGKRPQGKKSRGGKKGRRQRV
ncbi:regakine-1-like [Notolabrus celidotus]|uniref:regakine-1-like n=1 Tax=Notolabrus celidotus TaxID=1203425 RepID=UPI0014905C2F|nr:regakine-1-like [Notolabrus celidotus]